MAINKKLIHFKNKENFEREVANGNILDTSIVFILDTKEIYTHGTIYDGSTFDPSDIETSILEINNRFNISLEYDLVEYPDILDENNNPIFTSVEEGQTLERAINTLETNVATLAQEVLNNEEVVSEALVDTANSVGLDENFHYIQNIDANYISSATSLAEADLLLDLAIKEAKEVFIITSDMIEETATAGELTAHTLTFTDEGWSDFIEAVEANKIIALDSNVCGTVILQATPMATNIVLTGYFILAGLSYYPTEGLVNGFLSWVSQTEDSPAAYVIIFSNKNVTSSVINTPSEIYYLDPNTYSTSEDFNNLKAAIEANKIVVININDIPTIAIPFTVDDYQIGLSFSGAIPDHFNVEDCLLQYGGYSCKSYGTITDITGDGANVLFLKNSGDGTKFLADDGEYKEIVVPTKVSELENDANYFSNDKSIEDGVYIYTTDNEFIKPDDWDTTNNNKAVAIAIIDHRCSFGIPLGSSIFNIASFMGHVYGGKGIDIAEIPNCTTTEEALNDFNGYSHTQAIIQQSFSSAAKIAYNHTFPNGEHGYLPSYGELYVFSLYKDAIANAANKVGKDYNYDNFEMYGHIISSTEYGANSYYGIIYGGYTNEYDDAVVDKDYNHYTDFSTASDYYNQVIPFLHIERPKELIQTDGDGTKFLADDGTYKTIDIASILSRLDALEGK